MCFLPPGRVIHICGDRNSPSKRGPIWRSPTFFWATSRTPRDVQRRTWGGSSPIYPKNSWKIQHGWEIPEVNEGWRGKSSNELEDVHGFSIFSMFDDTGGYHFFLNLQLLQAHYSSFRLWAWEVFDLENTGTAFHEVPSFIAADMGSFMQVVSEDS